MVALFAMYGLVELVHNGAVERGRKVSYEAGIFHMGSFRGAGKYLVCACYNFIAGELLGGLEPVV
jgi:hypothetical protein